MAGRPRQGGPSHQALQRQQGHGVLLHQGEGPLLRLDVGKVAQPAQVIAEHRDREGVAEHLPAVLLGLLAPAQGIQHGDADPMPVHGLHDPCRLGSLVEHGQGLLGPATPEQLAGHLGGGVGPAQLGGLEQPHIATQITASQGELLHGQAVDGAALEQDLLQAQQTRFPQNRCQGGNQARKLAVAVRLQQLSRLFHQGFWVAGRRRGEGGQGVHPPFEQADHGARGVGTAVEHTL
jgi:hypothetical protein